jgi:hypothetical protein
MTKQVANTILQQLGGGSFCIMVGAKFIASIKNGVSFKIMRNASKATHVRITLQPNYTYTVEFIMCRGTTMSTVKEVENVYGDQLVELFEQTTQLNTKLY